MTIVEALKESKESGQAYSRMGAGFSGWIKWDDEHSYYDLTAEDLTADDWRPDHEVVEAITGGRWTTRKSQP